MSTEMNKTVVGRYFEENLVIKRLRKAERLNAQDQSESVVYFSHSIGRHRTCEIEAVSLRVQKTSRVQ